MMILLTIVVFIFILGLLVFVHELGHFVAAKRAGMKVEEFGFGFPPRMFGIKRGETTYSVNWIPLGGFVKILGEDGMSSDPRAFGNGTFPRRLLVLLAGVLMNFLLGYLLLFLGFSIIGTPVEIEEGADMGRATLSETKLSIIGVQDDSPAQTAGFKPGDVILTVDGIKFTDISELISYTKSRAGTEVSYELQRGDEIFKRMAIPRVNPPEGTGAVGFSPALVAIAKYPLVDSLRLAGLSFYYRITGIFLALAGLVTKLFSSGQISEGLSGPVGIAVLTKDFINLGLVYVVQFTAVLTINLGLINAFPFPALDGGRVLFLIIEKIRGAKSLKIERHANMIGFVLLMLLMVVITFRDIGRYSEEFKRLFERIL